MASTAGRGHDAHQPHPPHLPLLPAGRAPRSAITLLAAATLLGAAAAGIWWADQSLRERYGEIRTRLERQLGELLGRPLRLGPYSGLSWAGLELGSSHLLAGPRDTSTAEVAGIRVSLDPIASIQQRQPVLQIGLRDAQVHLHRNAQGQYWVMGRPTPGKPPRLEVQLRLLGPARVRIDPLGEQLQISGAVTLQPARQQLSLKARVQPRSGGELVANLHGRWASGDWRLALQGRTLALDPLRRLLGLPGVLRGEAGGSLRLQRRGGRLSCQGHWQVPRLQWQPRVGQLLQAEALSLDCAAAELTLTARRWRAAGWSGGARLVFSPGSRRIRLGLEGRPPGAAAAPVSLRAQGTLKGLGVERLELQAWRGGSRLWLNGSVGREWNLSSRFQLRPADLAPAASLPPWLLRDTLNGQLRLQGPIRQPLASGSLQQAANPLLGRWRAALAWREGNLRLQEFTSPHLSASGALPLRLGGATGLRAGQLDLRLSLKRYPLARLNPLVGARLEGVLEADGTVRGPLGALVPDLMLDLDRLSAGPVGLQERWRGRWLGDARGGGDLSMEALAPAAPGALTARLDHGWVPVAMRLERSDGVLTLRGEPRSYTWQASRLPLQGLMLAVGPSSRFQPLQGRLSGSGKLNLEHLAFAGRVAIDSPVFLGVRGRSFGLQGRYSDRRYSASGRFLPQDDGQLLFTWSGAWKGPFRSRLEGRGLGDPLVRQLAEAWPQWRDGPPPQGGSATDLAGLFIDTFGGTIQDQLIALEAARARVAAARGAESRVSLEERLEALRTRVDLRLDLSGPNLAAARADLELRSHLWLAGEDADLALTQAPLVARLEGPVSSGSGEFSFEQLPLALVALLTPIPEGLTGSLRGTGRYRLAGRESQQLALDLGLDEASLQKIPLSLERGVVALDGRRLRLDLALRAAGASSSVDLAGLVPLDPADQQLELRLASRGDGVFFMAALADPVLQWQKGSADLQLLVRGSLQEPIANGFVRVRDGELRFIDQSVRDLNALVLFDFERLEVQQLTASVGSAGKVSGSGSLAIWNAPAQGASAVLAVQLKDVPFKLPRIQAVANGNLSLGGSLRELRMGGDVRIAKGSLNLQGGQLASETKVAAQPVTVPKLAEAGWDFRKPLLLLGPEVRSDATEALASNVPKFSPLAFDGLRLRLGPDLRVGVPNVASFSTGGLLQLSGRLDPSLRATGVVRLLGGRLNLFTTSFSLDPDAPNVAVFTPALGLMPYVDIAMRTRVADSLSTPGIGTGGLGTANAQGLSAQPQSGFNSLSQLNLVRITVSVSGPADRLAENLRLRSSPPLSQERLIALIGGNSLAGLTGGGAGAALATVLGQSLLSPVLGGLSEAFGQRLSFALYPTYVTPALNDANEARSGQVAPELVLGSEIGLDITERLNASVLAAPNRSDIPPQLTLTYKASENLGLQGGFDTQGAWQGEMQLFFRF
ncbi:MAG: translocation/assembly module TamB domain-containing protein [Cyanobacteriota bacterium]|nr:translocation/assembly module TamB domain-containing protein [Cyanobacteriota bacterium]